jgi:dihydroorotate dehydrogenase
MGIVYEKLLKPVLFSQDPEKMHDYSLIALKTLGSIPPLCRLLEWSNRLEKAKPISLFGLKFPNMVGLAAGYDKNAECLNSAAALGFGHLEIGTVTRHKQPGNPRPRLFRYPNQHAIINQMGFNNEGAEAIATRISKIPPPGQRKIPIGINIGKTKKVPLEEAIDDYLGSFNMLADYADYFAINVSSPNTPDLRKLQSKDYLPDLLDAIMTTNRDRARKMGTKPIPIILKIAPDLSFKDIDDVLETILEKKLDGITATNTTVSRPGDMSSIQQAGGLSGKPLHSKSLEVVRYIHKATEGKIPIIGVGGIDDPVSAGSLADAGASLIQIYTGIIFRGPFLAKEIAQALYWRHSNWL